jgi:hypothetical protein
MQSWFGVIDLQDREMQPTSPTGPLRFKSARGALAITRTVAAAMFLLGLAVPPASTQPPRPNEYDVKATYLLDFGKFIRSSRTSSPHSSFDICTLGRDPMGSSLDALAANSTVGNLPVRVNHVPDVTSAKSCAIVFISSSEGDRLREDLAILGDADLLTVSDAPGFLEHGGMIQFVLVSHHIRFAVNLDAVNRAHIVLSSELLRVASSVSGKTPTGELP